jgi:hypothetical protein
MYCSDSEIDCQKTYIASKESASFPVSVFKSSSFPEMQRINVYKWAMKCIDKNTALM